MMEPFPLALLAKPFLYCSVFETARRWSADPRRISAWTSISAALWRLVGGILIGTPFALAFSRSSESGFLVAFSVFRFLLWFLCLRLLFQNLRPRLQLLLAFAGTGLNWALDLLAFGNHFWFDWRLFTGC